MEGKERLDNILREAERLLAKHEGVHKMHSSRGGLLGWKSLAEEFGYDVINWNNVDILIRQMRICDANGGQFPS